MKKEKMLLLMILHAIPTFPKQQFPDILTTPIPLLWKIRKSFQKHWKISITKKTKWRESSPMEKQNLWELLYRISEITTIPKY